MSDDAHGIARVIAEAGGVVVTRQGRMDLGDETPTRAVPARGPGRPLGSRNRRTEEFRLLLEGMGGMPGPFLGRLIATPTELLAAQLGCEKRQALEQQIAAARILMPYVEQELPKAVEVDGKGQIAFAVLDPRHLLEQAGEEAPVILADQGVSDGQG